MIENNSELLEINNLQNLINQVQNLQNLIKVLIRTKKFDFKSIDSKGNNLLHQTLKDKIVID